MRNYFVPYMMLEFIFVAVFIWKYGFLALILEIILSVIAGIVLISKFGMLDLIQEFKNIKSDNIFGNFGIAAGGMMLMFPGILSDTAGIFIIVVTLVMKFLDKNGRNTQNNTYNYTYKNTYYSSQNKQDDIIDVEIIEENEVIKRG